MLFRQEEPTRDKLLPKVQYLRIKLAHTAQCSPYPISIWQVALPVTRLAALRCAALSHSGFGCYVVHVCPKQLADFCL